MFRLLTSLVISWFGGIVGWSGLDQPVTPQVWSILVTSSTLPHQWNAMFMLPCALLYFDVHFHFVSLHLAFYCVAYHICASCCCDVLGIPPMHDHFMMDPRFIPCALIIYSSSPLCIFELIFSMWHINFSINVHFFKIIFVLSNPSVKFHSIWRCFGWVSKCLKFELNSNLLYFLSSKIS